MIDILKEILAKRMEYFVKFERTPLDLYVEHDIFFALRNHYP